MLTRRKFFRGAAAAAVVVPVALFLLERRAAVADPPLFVSNDGGRTWAVEQWAGGITWADSPDHTIHRQFEVWETAFGQKA